MDTKRREWNKEEYNQRIADKKKETKRTIDHQNDHNLSLAKAREGDLLLEENLGKTYILTAQQEELGAGFYCKFCVESFHDNLSFLDHINGPVHLKKVGMSTRVARSTVEDVKRRIQSRKVVNVVLDPREKMEQRLQEIADQRRKRREERRLLKESTEDQDVKEMMGFGGFSSKK